MDSIHEVPKSIHAMLFMSFLFLIFSRMRRTLVILGFASLGLNFSSFLIQETLLSLACILI